MLISNSTARTRYLCLFTPVCCSVTMLLLDEGHSTATVIHICALDFLHRKPRINSQLVAQQAAQQYTMPPPPKKDRRERSERTDKERLHSEGERAGGEGRPEGERPESVAPEGDLTEKDKSEIEQPVKDKPDREKDIIPAVTKKPSSKKTKLVSELVCWVVTLA